MAMMDPRQSRMFPPPPHLMQNMPPRPPLIPSLDSIPTPKYPHPSQMQNVSQPSPPGIQPPPPGTTTTTMNNTGSKPSSLNLDTSLPPPFFNRIDGHDSTPVSPVLYHPTNPPHLPPAFFPPLMVGKN